ncbi:tetratricopeptide repeat protein [Pseudomonas sp. P155]|uniref:Tetratricopeptide repeat protein n=1 Tax=Pseudomonas neuropathica TaxID=2730425 RepID=A0ABS0BFG6_9PSED|nr:tetratricopeptide repeat protein [Pseudomonas neuropathica]MBF6033083.1 tetratricopeptide repeat protein [Pseudomonas neuropathica]
MPVPQLATAGITDRIQALSDQETKRPFDVKSIERDIERLKAISAAEAFMLSGMLKAALGEYDASKELHLKNLRLSMDEVGLVNYGISLRMLGRYTEAKVYFLKALERSPGSPEILEKIVHTSTFVCDYEDLEKIVAGFARANPTFVIEDMPCMATARSVISHLGEMNISLSEYKLVGTFVEQAMIEFGLVASFMHEKLSNFDGVKHIYIEVPLPVKDAAQLVAINDRVAELVLGCDDILSWDRLVVNFIDRRSVLSSAVA